MKVLFFSRDYTPHDFRFLKALEDIGHDPWYLRLEHRVNYESRPLPPSVHVVPWRWGTDVYDWHDEEETIEALRGIVDRLKPDVIHTGPLSDASYLAAKADLHPHVVMSWGFDLQREIFESEQWKRQMSFALQHADWFLGDCFVELEIAERLGLPQNIGTIFPWGIDVDKFSPKDSPIRAKLASNDEILVICTRTMEPPYDVETTVRGFLKAAKVIRNIKLVLLGDGSQRERIKQIADTDSDGSKVIWAGRLSNDQLADYYQAADIYISSSLVDGSSISLIEAMGCQKTVLVSSIAGNREWVESGKNGLLFETKNPDDLAEKLIYLCKNKEIRMNMAENARRLVCQKADWNKNKYLLTNAYQGAIQRCERH